MDKPIHLHDCDSCRFYGTIDTLFDVYRCHKTLIIRYGSDPVENITESRTDESELDQARSVVEKMKLHERVCDRSGACRAYANPYASTRWHKGQWTVTVSHGSGPGRSYGYANVDKAESCGWANGGSTGHIAVFNVESDANQYADEQTAYYDGSDYANR